MDDCPTCQTAPDWCHVTLDESTPVRVREWIESRVRLAGCAGEAVEVWIRTQVRSEE